MPLRGNVLGFASLDALSLIGSWPWKALKDLSCYSSFHFLFNYPYITPISYNRVGFLFHYPYITPI